MKNKKGIVGLILIVVFLIIIALAIWYVVIPVFQSFTGKAISSINDFNLFNSSDNLINKSIGIVNKTIR